MAGQLKLVVFDVDGTLVDSQGDILASMAAAFEGAKLPVPTDQDILGVVGLSLPVAIDRLHSGLSDQDLAQAVEGYKSAYVDRRARHGADSSPFYDGVRDVLSDLASYEDVLLGVATGKSRRGLDLLLKAHDMTGLFVTTQVADDHPSKPNPSMLLKALSETGCDARDAVMIGDTEFDMAMANAANISGIGVTWGYHPVDRLAQTNPAALVHRSTDLAATIKDILELEQ